VSGPLFEQYREALRRGHLSTLAGNLGDALEAYREAARLVPERTLALASQGTLLHKLDRWPEAAEAFDSALRIAPDDEATLRARATARAERGMRSGAAADFERLAFVVDVAGRAGEAADAARRADEQEPTPARAALARRLARAAAGRPADDDASAGADPAATAADAATSVQDAPIIAGDGAGAWPAEDDLAGERNFGAEYEKEHEGSPRTSSPVDQRHWPAIDLPSPPPPPIVGPPPDTDVLMAEAADLYDAGDAAAAGDRMLTVVAVHRAAGRLDAALDVCFQLLAIDPGDPHVHLAIANLQLDRGWTPLAREKIDLLVRLTSLTGDTQAEADVHGLAAERLRDEPVGSAGRR
jgi:tetratricopeptide (TPR) repeat protein